MIIAGEFVRYRWYIFISYFDDNRRWICPVQRIYIHQLFCYYTFIIPNVIDVVFSLIVVYGYGIAANAICCVCSLGGAVILPCAKRFSSAYHVFLSVFLGLAVGTLFTGAIVHLIPEVMLFIFAWYKWMSDYCLTPNEQLYSYIMARTSYILMRFMMMMSTLF
jgi:hypothetical protein